MTYIETVPTTRLRIAELARSRQIGVRELARRSNISYRIIQAAWHSRGNPTVETLARIAEALAVEITELFDPAEV